MSRHEDRPALTLTFNRHAVAGASTVEADAAFAKYCAQRDAAPRLSPREQLVAQLGEELARERFPHWFA